MQYIKNTYNNNRKTNNPISKWANRIDISLKLTQGSNKHVKRKPILLVTREMYTQANMTDHFTSSGMPITKTQVEKLEYWYAAGGNVQWYSYFVKQ